MCISPLTLKNEYRTISGETTRVVPCGRCHICYRRRANGWTFRLYEELKQSQTAFFLTLTYDEKTVPITKNGKMTVVKKDLQNYIKRLRKEHPKVPYIKKNGKTGYKSNIKYYAVGEYGSQFIRPHYHIIMLNVDPDYVKKGSLLTHWTYVENSIRCPIGIVDIGTVTMPSIRYVTSYIMSGHWVPDDIVNIETGEIYQDDRNPHFAIMSKGIGINHLTPQMVQYYVNGLIGYARFPDGKICSLPRYFKEKVFSPQERRELAAQAKELAELDMNGFINDPKFHHEWRKDQLRQHEKLQQLSKVKF